MLKLSYVLKILVTFLFASKVFAQNADEIERSRQQIQNALSSNSAIVVASRKNEKEVINYVKSFYQKTGLSEADVSFTIYLSDNGWFGISVGDTPANQCDQTLRNLVSQALIPDDSFCTNAQSYIAAFEIRDNALNPLLGKNYFAEGSEPTVQTLSVSGDYDWNFDILLNSSTHFEILEKLDGSRYISSNGSTSTYSFCIHPDLASYEAIDEGFFSSVVQQAIKEEIRGAEFDMNDKTLDYVGDCSVSAKRLHDWYHIAVVHRPTLRVLNASYWARIAEVSDKQIRKIAATLQKATKEAAETQEALKDEYVKLAEDASELKIGSLNLSYPDDTEETQICTKAISGDAAIPFIQYLRHRNGGVFSDGLIDAATKSYSGASFFDKGYAFVYDNLDDFYFNWQKSSTSNCDVWVDYPAEIIKFLDAAVGIDPNLAYEFNKLVPVADLFDIEAKEQGFSDWGQLQFGKAISASSTQLSELKKFEIVSNETWESLIEEIRKSGYDSSARPSVALEYLRDKKAALTSEKTALDIRNARLARQAAERNRRAKAKRAGEAEEARKRAENIKKGEGTFVYYDDGSCTEGKESYCVKKDEFNDMCEKAGYRVRSSGLFDIYSFALMSMPSLRDLYQNDRSSVSDAHTYVTGNDDCVFRFNIDGFIKGTSINKAVYCNVSRIKGRSGVFYTDNESVLDCFAR